MQSDDRAAIESLFGRLSTVESQAPQRDAAAEAYISEKIAAQPGAPYYMAQTIVMQEHALAQSQARIQELEAQAAQPQAAAGGGLFGGLFGGGQQAPQRPASVHTPQAPAQGGGFLAGAAQTAMGVAGGMLMANAIGNMMGSGEAEAAEAPADDASEEGGGVFDMFGGGDFEGDE